ncbi:DUF4870 domain-containing protein [Nesterenkonia sp.]|uniref:DUF4870 domain-containing protein n=1 Tax=Nesterenkonia sp. TaxID=704201 RepID=UPI00262BE058|nr:DUF4870 domain-containing protein [Nesterenkonia sp.]
MSQHPQGPGDPHDPRYGHHSPYGDGPTPAPLSAGEEQGWGVAIHLGGIFVSWLVPLVVWLVFRERSRMIDDHGKEALNWQITLFIAYVIGGILTVVLIGFVVILAAWLCALIFGIIAAVAAYQRRPYRYPFNIRFIK